MRAVEKVAVKKCAVFVFPHQDDEFGVLHAITSEIHANREVWCVYFTDGGPKAKQRNRESLRALSRLGVQSQHVLFQGQSLGIKDGRLAQNMDQATNWFMPFLRSLGDIEHVFVPAWEGGHPDHDALHVITCNVMNSLGLLGRVRQFSLYNAYKKRAPLFRVMSPLEENGRVEQQSISVSDRLKYVSICLGYPSQLISWVGLFPFVAYNYFFKGKQRVQKVSLGRLKCRPHEGGLYYEQRGFETWANMTYLVSMYLSKHKV